MLSSFVPSRSARKPKDTSRSLSVLLKRRRTSTESDGSTSSKEPIWLSLAQLSMDPRFALSLPSFLPLRFVPPKLTFDASLLSPPSCSVQVADPPFILHMSIGSESYVSRPKYAPQGTSRLERLEKDLEQARKLALLLEDEEKESVPEGLVRGSEKIDELGREAAKLVESRESGGASLDEKKQLVSCLRLRLSFRLELRTRR